LNIELPKENTSPGFYQLTEKNSGFNRTFALNITKDESETTFYTISELKKMFENYKHIQILDGIDTKVFENEFKEQVQNKPLWQYCLYICLIFLLFEVLLIRFL
jgi:hypothetical protein